MADQSVTMVGTLGADPSLRYTQGGQPMCSFRIAISKRWKKDNEWQEKTTFMSCTAWGSLGENISASCAKGTRVICVGTIEQRDYEDDGGAKRTVLELQVEECAPALRWAQAVVEKNPRKDER